MRRSDSEHHPGADSPPGHPRLKLAAEPSAWDTWAQRQQV
jgi:hypothetical protein